MIDTDKAMSARENIAEMVRKVFSFPHDSLSAADAILSALPSLGYVHRDDIRVKPLEWEATNGNYPIWRAFCLVTHSSYKIDRGRARCFGEYPLTKDGAAVGEPNSLSEAKTLAESSRKSRILPALDIQEPQT